MSEICKKNVQGVNQFQKNEKPSLHSDKPQLYVQIIINTLEGKKYFYILCPVHEFLSKSAKCICPTTQYAIKRFAEYICRSCEDCLKSNITRKPRISQMHFARILKHPNFRMISH